MKKWVIGILASVMLAAFPVIGVFASQSMGGVSIEVTSNHVVAGVREVDVPGFVIRESAPGALEKDKTLYFEVEHLKFDADVDYEILEGDIQIKDVETDDSILAITIDRESSKEAAAIAITGVKLYLDGSLSAGNYGLNIVTVENSQFPNNMLGENYSEDEVGATFDTQSIEVLEDFVVIEKQEEKTQAPTETLTATVGKDTLQAGDKVITDANIYISGENRVMLPVRAVIEALSDTAVIHWDDLSKTVSISMGSRIITMTVGNAYMIVNGTNVPMEGEMEIVDGRSFIPMRDLGHALGIPDNKIVWDEKTQTVTLN